ncbi:MAG: Glucokinase [Syntrophomonadaceae bacterium]|nr:Glucokinase [Bacillota bacterium]
MKEKLYVAIDLGGTKIYTVLGNGEGSILAEEIFATKAHDGPQAVLEQLVLSVSALLAKTSYGLNDLQAAGICAAGFFDWQKRLLVHSPNLSGWNNVPLELELTARLGLPVLAENDANAAALGEARLGAGAGSGDLIFVTVSTGIGAGLILGGHIYRGTAGFAGEFGHMVVKSDGYLCGCGRRGCLETVASGTAIARAASTAMQMGRETLLTQLAEENEGKLGAPQVFAAAELGDVLAGEILADASYYLGLGLVNLVNLLNPEIIVVGGGVANAGDKFLQPLREAIADKAIPPAAASCTLRAAKLGMAAGVIGMLCRLAEQN